MALFAGIIHRPHQQVARPTLARSLRCDAPQLRARRQRAGLTTVITRLDL
ncbi:MAG: hypothetical protein AAGH73_03010 [Pseudomonadota bacterium]